MRRLFPRVRHHLLARGRQAIGGVLPLRQGRIARRAAGAGLVIAAAFDGVAQELSLIHI